MATVLDNLNRAYANMAARYAEVTAELAVDTSDQGRSAALAGAQRNLMEQMSLIRKQIQAEGGPYCVTQIGRSV